MKAWEVQYGVAVYTAVGNNAASVVKKLLKQSVADELTNPTQLVITVKWRDDVEDGYEFEGLMTVID